MNQVQVGGRISKAWCGRHRGIDFLWNIVWNKGFDRHRAKERYQGFWQDSDMDFLGECCDGLILELR